MEGAPARVPLNDLFLVSNVFMGKSLSYDFSIRRMARYPVRLREDLKSAHRPKFCQFSHSAVVSKWGFVVLASVIEHHIP